jgi:hypothetical protein
MLQESLCKKKIQIKWKYRIAEKANQNTGNQYADGHENNIKAALKNSLCTYKLVKNTLVWQVYDVYDKHPVF